MYIDIDIALVDVAVIGVILRSHNSKHIFGVWLASKVWLFFVQPHSTPLTYLFPHVLSWVAAIIQCDINPLCVKVSNKQKLGLDDKHNF